VQAPCHFGSPVNYKQKQSLMTIELPDGMNGVQPRAESWTSNGNGNSHVIGNPFNR
jgi:hypothetical protein